MGWLKAGKQYGVPQATLRRRVSNGKNNILRGTEKGLGRYKCTFDKNLERELVDHIKLLESRMFGLTAIECLINGSKTKQDICCQGEKTVGCLTSAERGQHVTVVCCMGTTGRFIPPALIFPRKNWKHELLDGAPVGTLGLVQEKVWMTGEVFLQWLEHFCRHVKASLEDKIFYDQEITRLLKAHPGGVVTQYQISSILSVAFGKAASVKTAQSGFQKTELCPLNADIFEDHQFAPNKDTAKRRAIQGPTELTSTPNIKMTKQKAEEKKSRVQRQSKRIVKKELEFSQEEADDSFDDDDDDDDDDDACLYCSDVYSQSKPKETWFQCMKCKI
ncbi:hypothetical protein ANN_03751 [Periplaneta americana]|uniref:DDE-1 domain-containing protein n=1 Tax=Periplaneta americana TaxID=6978 RepID=A0ABQ8TZS7_PERAM|nr:hypothetical protein ANN_03751 [Periplaneta americana]